VINRDEPIPIRQPSRGRRVAIIAFVALVILLMALRSIATFWTDYLWYDSVDQLRVWRTLIFTRVWLVVLATLIAFAMFWVNLAIADRLSPRSMALVSGPDEELLERFHIWIEPRARRVRLLVAAFFGVTMGLGTAVLWEDFLYWRHGGSFGLADPIFSNDLGAYVFDLPFYRALFNWSFQLMLFVALVTVLVHYLNGGIPVQSLRRISPSVKAHISVLFAGVALLKAVGYALDRWELLIPGRTNPLGALYTDVNARVPALNLLILISLVAAVILLVNLRFRGWTLPLVAVGLWLGTSIIIGGIYPAVVQRFQVQPDELNKEREFYGHNIQATNSAFGLAGIEVDAFQASSDLDAEAINANESTIDNIRLWDPSVLRTTYSELQEIRTFYGIRDVDVDRYMIDGELTQVMVSARELDEQGLPSRGWLNERLIYTHGFGAVISPANSVTVEGQPSFFVSDIPPVAEVDSLEVAQPRIYFSDVAEGDYTIVDTNEAEVDFPEGGGDQLATNNYDGAGGVDLGGVFRRAAWALRFGHVDVLISGQLRADSKVMLERNIRDRVARVTPFLDADADPYLVALEDRLVWVMDLYTTTDRYPYSSIADTSRLDRGPGLDNGFNYIRNSVKAVVDAFDGTMTLYVVDDTDPLIQAQQRIFPTVFVDGSEMPQEIRDHLRYPEDMFRVQSDMYTLYHMNDPNVFFRVADPWEIAVDPSNSSRADLRGQFAERPMLPYYLLIQLPGDEELSFVIMQPFTPLDRPNMVSFIVAKSGPAEYGRLIDFRLPAQTAQQGPGQVGEFINQSPEISEQFTLLGQGGSRVIQGNMLVIPIEESLLYVQPIYIAADQAGAATDEGIPEFKKVVVSYDGNIQMRDSLAEALAAVIPGLDVGPGDPGDPGAPGDPGVIPEEISALVAAAEAALADADAALRNGDLATYGAKVQEATDLIRRAQILLAAADPTT
jgi:uncharacterized membrane protein (UPF0182 family)